MKSISDTPASIVCSNISSNVGAVLSSTTTSNSCDVSFNDSSTNLTVTV